MTNNTLISLDIFDTAIVRDVYHPSDIFKLIEEEVGNNFFDKRVEAEIKASKEVDNYGLADIYKNLPEFNPEVEIEYELKHCKSSGRFSSLYDSKRCVFISDMYLPSEVLVKILENAGYKNPKVFVSCEMNANKSTGELFEKVEKATEKKIAVHFGDNYIADMEGAKKVGIKCIFRPALRHIDLNLPRVKNPMLKNYLAESACYDSLYKLAKWYAPIIFEFTKWVLSKRKEGQKVFFLSRDMFMPYHIATKILCEKDVYYLHASRRSLAGLVIDKDDNFANERVKGIFNAEELERVKKNKGTEAMKYLRKFDIKSGDMIADIGFGGTIQTIIDSALNVKTKGLYMQVSSYANKDIDVEMFLSRIAIHFCLIIEFIFGSPEDVIEGYKNGEVVFIEDHKQRKEYSKKILSFVLDSIHEIENFNTSLFDIEQILIHTQYYADNDLIQLYNQKIYSNRNSAESIVNYNESEIYNGNLRELYANSYCQPMFKLMLEQNKLLKHLSKLI